MTRGEGQGRLLDEMRRCHGHALKTARVAPGKAKATKTAKCKRDSPLERRAMESRSSLRSESVTKLRKGDFFARKAIVFRIAFRKNQKSHNLSE
jgi:hypothetical protein